MQATTPDDVERAFRAWCAVMDLPATGVGKVGRFRLDRDDRGKLRIEQVLGDEAAPSWVTPAMTDAEFCAAVDFLVASFRVKTVLVAKTVARRMAGGRGRS